MNIFNTVHLINREITWINMMCMHSVSLREVCLKLNLTSSKTLFFFQNILAMCTYNDKSHWPHQCLDEILQDITAVNACPWRNILFNAPSQIDDFVKGYV